MAEGIPEYDELKLRIEPGPRRSYRVLAFGPDGSTASGTFTAPFDKTELQNFILQVGLPRRSTRAFRSPQMEEAKRFGSELCDALLQGGVRKVYESARALADARERGLRVTLYLTGVPELMEIPWEFLYERPSFLSQSIYTPVVRSLDLESVREPRKLALPLQILGMVSRPAGFETLDVDDERRKLERALGTLTQEGLVELVWLERATLGELDRIVAAPDEVHVVHYIGHGAYDERTQGGILVLEDAQGGPQEVTGEDLGSLLQDERSLRLVVLNSCEGARTSHVDPFSGVASSLVERRIPAVIGMQFEITDQAAITFSERLYTALAQGFPVDAALAHARKAIFAGGNDIEFGTPVLFLRATDARLFDVGGGRVVPAGQEAPVVGIAKGAFALRLEQQPPEARAGGEVTWTLTIENTGGCRLADVTARRAEGESLADPVDLDSSQRQVIRWTESVQPGLRHLITVTAIDPEGSRISEQITASASGPSPKREPVRSRLLIAGAALALLAAGAIVWLAVPGGELDPPPDVAGEEIATIDLPGRPDHVAAGAGAVWVTLPEQQSIGRIDRDTDQLSETTEVGGSPRNVALGEGSLWVTKAADETVQRIDRTTGQLMGEPIPVGGRPGSIAVGEGAVWVRNSTDVTVLRIDPDTHLVDEVVPVGGTPQGGPTAGTLAVGEGGVWARRSDGAILKIDPETNEPAGDPIPIGGDVGTVAVGEGAVWVTNRTDDTLVRIDPDDDEVEGEPIDLIGDAFGVTAGDGAVWVTNSGANAVTRVDPRTDAIVDDPVGVGRGPEDVEVGGGAVWVTNSDDNTISHVEPSP